MNDLNLANNLSRLRRERKITQEELADFIGVTKAAVSKWENRQSTPDILLLPQLASFFGVTVDELIGYEAQMSKEQIRRCYTELTGNFVKLPFDEAMGHVRKLVHRYYSCYPFLLQVCVLYLNHFMLTESREDQKEILREANALCDRILSRCSDMGVCQDAAAIKAMLNLQMGNVNEVIEMLEPITDPSGISGGNEETLIQAYQMAGDIEKAKSYNQVRLYLHLLYLVGAEMRMMVLYGDDPGRCEEAIRHAEGIVELYQLQRLHPNMAAQFYYQAAVTCAANKEEEKALEELKKFEQCIVELMNGETVLLHGDAYFDMLDSWISELPLGEQAPRDLRFVRQNVLGALASPAFEGLKETEVYKSICRRFEKGEH